MLQPIPMRVAIPILLAAFPLLAQFRSTSTLVIAPTTITDPAGKYIDGLQPEHLILYDNNVPQPIQVEEAFNPLSLIVAIQTSANASANLDKLGDTGILFTHLVAGDRGQTSILAFSDTTRVLDDFTANPDRLAAQLRNLRPQGNDAVTLEAVMEALTILGKRPPVNRRVLLIIGEARGRSSKL